MPFEFGKTPKDETLLLIQEIKLSVKALPYNEFKYYLMLLLASIRNEPCPQKHKALLAKITPLIERIKQFYINPEDVDTNILNVTEALNELVEATRMQTITQRIKKIVLNICGAIIAIITGLIGCIVGIIMGFTSNYNVVGNIKGIGLGFVSGLALGVMVGYRIPKKLLQTQIDTKLEFCTDNLLRLHEELMERRTHEEYQNETKEYILNTFFPEIPEENREERFNAFLTEPQSFQICTTTAGHISSSLKGYLGHHSLIRFKINGIKDTPIEYGDRKRTPNFVDQSETPREVNGQTLFDMLALDRMLQDTHAYTIKKAIRIYDIGSDDCRTYVDKILIGTGQEPTKIGRFSQTNDAFVGRKIVKPLIGFFSKMQEDELYSLMDKPDDEMFEITQHTFMGKGAGPQF